MSDITQTAPRPAVDFDPTSQEFLRDPEPVLARLRAESPVFYSPQGDFWGITRYDDITRALHDFRTFSQGVLGGVMVPDVYLDRVPQNFFNQSFTAMEPPEHTGFRKAGQKLMTRSRIKHLEEPIRALANGLIDDFVDDESCDLMNQYFYLITIGAIMQLLGLPLDGRDRLRQFAYEFAFIIQQQVVDVKGDGAAQIWENHASTRSWFYDIIEERRRDPSDDVISQMLAATDGEGRPVFDAQRIATHINEFIFGGTDTAANTMGSAFSYLDRDDALRAEVQANPELASAVFEETLRIGGPINGLWKKAMRDVEVRGVTIPEGSAVWLLLFSAGRDDAHFENPEVFDPHRPNVTDHVMFGLGRHFCLGAPLARLEGKIGLATLYERIPDIRIAPGATLRYQKTTIVRYIEELPAIWGSRLAAA